MNKIIPLPSAASRRVANPRWHGRYPRMVVPAWRVQKVREERAAVHRQATVEGARHLEGAAARRNLVETLKELTEAAKLGEFDGLIYIARISKDDMRLGSAGDFQSAVGGALLPEISETLTTFIDLLP